MSEKVKHPCDLTIVTCIDNRLRAHEQKVLYWLYKTERWALNLSRGLSLNEFIMEVLDVSNHLQYDLISIAGGAAGAPEQLLPNIQVSQDLHKPQLWVLCGHYDCGMKVHSEDVLRSVRNIIQNQDAMDKVIVLMLDPSDQSDEPWTDITAEL